LGGFEESFTAASKSMEASSEVQIVNKYGLHARPAAELVKLANRFASDVWIRKDEVEVSGKSIMGVMMLAAGKGSKVMLEVEGPDEKEAMEALTSLIADNFGEDQ